VSIKKINMEPTKENIEQTLLEDAFGRNVDITNFINILDGLNSHSVIALDGEWGSGKTFFIKQMIMVLDQLLSAKPKPIITGLMEEGKIKLCDRKMLIRPIYFNAWLYDDHNDPLLSVMYEICKNVNNEFSTETIKMSLLKAMEGLVSTFSGFRLNDVVEKTDVLSDVKIAESIKSMFDMLIDDTVTEKANKIVLFIDELDRCRPDYAVKLLERMKHFINDDRLIIVYSLNQLQLCHTVKAFYGNEFDATAYLGKFFDFSFKMKRVDMQNHMNKLLGGDQNYYVWNMAQDLQAVYNLSIREFNSFMQSWIPQGKKILEQQLDFETTEVQIARTMVLPLLLVLKLKSDKVFDDFVNGRDGTPLYEFVSKSKVAQHYIDARYQVEGRGENFIMDMTKEIYKMACAKHGVKISIAKGMMEEDIRMLQIDVFDMINDIL